MSAPHTPIMHYMEFPERSHGSSLINFKNERRYRNESWENSTNWIGKKKFPDFPIIRRCLSLTSCIYETSSRVLLKFLLEKILHLVTRNFSISFISVFKGLGWFFTAFLSRNFLSENYKIKSEKGGWSIRIFIICIVKFSFRY